VVHLGYPLAHHTSPLEKVLQRLMLPAMFSEYCESGMITRAVLWLAASRRGETKQEIHLRAT